MAFKPKVQTPPSSSTRKNIKKKKLSGHRLFDINFSTISSEKELKKTQKIYKKQCKKLITPEHQESLIKILTIGRLYKIPFLIWLKYAFFFY